MPLISIILPTYNVEKYIARALDSCINQTLQDIEIIVVDDKGQDKSIDIAKEYASRDNRIKIIDNIENKGTYEARNVGVRNASSELIMFLDPDDELEFNACKKAFECISQDNLDFVCFNFKNYKVNEIKDNKFVSFNETILNINDHKKLFSQYGWDFWGWTIWNKAYKKSIYLESVLKINTNGNKMNMAEDALAFYFIVTNCKGKVGYINEFLYKYYENPSSITNQDNDKKNKTIQQYETVLNIIENSCDNDFLNKYLIHLTIFYWHYKCDKLYDYEQYLHYIAKNKNDYIFNRKIYVKEKLWIYKNIKKAKFKYFLYYLFYKVMDKF